MTNESKQITAKFTGRCTKCHGVVPSGTQCMWERGAGVRHVTCPVVSNGVYSSQAVDAVEAALRADSKQVTVTMGVFKKDGRIYVVKPNKDKTRVYAKEIVESPARMTENGEVAEFEAVYAKGIVFKLTEADRWDMADAKDFLSKFAKCIVCGRHLKAAKSVAGAIGPVCAKYFAHKHDEPKLAKPVKLAEVAAETEEQTINRLAANMQAATPLMVAADAAVREQALIDAEDAWKARQIAQQVESDDRAAELLLNAKARPAAVDADFGYDKPGKLDNYWVDDAGRAHSEPEPMVS